MGVFREGDKTPESGLVVVYRCCGSQFGLGLGII